MKTPLEVLQCYPQHDYTLHGALRSRMVRDAQRPFLLFGEKTWSWDAFAAAADSLARALAARGIGKGDRVAIMAKNSDGHVLLLFALARLGAIMVPVNPDFGVDEARYVMHHAEVSGVAAAGDTLDVARSACHGLATAPWFVLPLFHINALFYSLAGTLAAGCNALILNKFSHPLSGTRSPIAASPRSTSVVFLDELPHTPTHKIAKAALRGDKTLQARAVDLGKALNTKH